MQDDRPRHGNGRHGGGDETRDNLPGTDSGFFTNHGFDRELDDNAFENTALNNLDPVHEAELFKEFEQDYRSGGYDPGPDRGRTRYHSAYRHPDQDSGYAQDSRPGDSGYREPDSGYQDSGYREPAGHPDDGRPRHGRSRDRHGSRDSQHSREDREGRRSRKAEGPARIPLFARKTKAAPAQRPATQPRSSSQSQSQSPFGDLAPYLLPILAGVVIVMVIVVLLLNR
ncbi:MAG TPA: hypothetical protein VHZ97_09190 [Pseudonocardiaceae bacterium]|jgi:hypothetical protein|nr:hypothetical protein [Pseudonocardiaceae bacterium]